MPSAADAFAAYIVESPTHAGWRLCRRDQLPVGDVLIRASYSSLNYKDALAATGVRGVAGDLPHLPGIDVAGVVETSDSPEWAPGDRVFVTGYDLGAPRWGGWSQYVSVPSDWVQPLPSERTELQVMQLGTAGFTAAQCVASLQHHRITPDRGEVLVTGATGGVGSLTVRLLAGLGYNVCAMTGKADQADALRRWGAARIIDRHAFDFDDDKPLRKATWAGAVDTVGGPILAALLTQIAHRGCVAACGNVAGTALPLTVFPLILRGVTLDGIDSAKCPAPERRMIWQQLLGPWAFDSLFEGTRTISRAEVAGAVEQMLRGQHTGRTVIDVNAGASEGLPPLAS